MDISPGLENSLSLRSESCEYTLGWERSYRWYNAAAVVGMENIGFLILALGLVLAAVGIALILGGPLIPLGRLPGDISWRWEGGSFYVPIVTCLLLSALASLVLNIVLRVLNRS